MRCDVVRKMLEEELERPEGVQAHLASCPGCREYLERWGLLRAGFAVLREAEPPEPSLGFAERLVRRLQEARESDAGQKFIVQAGRRMVYAMLLVAVMLMLGLVLPTSGPLRAPQAAESVLSAPQLASMPSDQFMGIDDTNYVPASQSRAGRKESK